MCERCSRMWKTVSVSSGLPIAAAISSALRSEAREDASSAHTRDWSWSTLAAALFPASTPVFVSAVKCTGALLAEQSLRGVENWILLTGGFDVMYFILALLTFELVLED